MSMIFDSFPNMKQARAFAAAAKQRYDGLASQVFDDADEAFQHDDCPLKQIPPIVHIDRIFMLGGRKCERLFRREFRSLEDAVGKHYGAFARIWDEDARITDAQIAEVVAECEADVIMRIALECEVEEMCKQFGGVCVHREVN
jgi:hypothetical protein